MSDVVVECDLRLALRSRSHEAHVAPQHVEELRKLIERVPANEPADRSDPRVIVDLEKGSVRGPLSVQQALELVVGALHHRPEVEHVERQTAQPDSLLPIEDRPRARDLHCDRDGQQKGLLSTISASDPMMSKSRFDACFRPSKAGYSTWMSGRPATGRA